MCTSGAGAGHYKHNETFAPPSRNSCGECARKVTDRVLLRDQSLFRTSRRPSEASRVTPARPFHTSVNRRICPFVRGISLHAAGLLFTRDYTRLVEQCAHPVR